ncbi:hypothetical protein FHS42_005899 [Streptomyces zagrosensis]|uniref:Uncharacterized protein n=1 Tax=Streptomyces zagrosensis TaxID=1042984 RepID=A0A7W9V118_9ACTN|nr:hypothetical protein [Streptomyces zagrosensis]
MPTASRGGRHPRPFDLSTWKQARGYGAQSKPSERDYGPGSWVMWTAPSGRRRMGVVSDDPFTLAAVKRSMQVGQSKEARCKAVVVPADGGDILPLCLPNSNNPHALLTDDGRWRPARPHHQQTQQRAVAA